MKELTSPAEDVGSNPPKAPPGVVGSSQSTTTFTAMGDDSRRGTNVIGTAASTCAMVVKTPVAAPTAAACVAAAAWTDANHSISTEVQSLDDDMASPPATAPIQQQQKQQHDYDALRSSTTPPPPEVASQSTPPMTETSKHHPHHGQAEHILNQQQQQQHIINSSSSHALSPSATSPTRKKRRTFSSFKAPTMPITGDAGTIERTTATSEKINKESSANEQQGSEYQGDERLQMRNEREYDDDDVDDEDNDEDEHDDSEGDQSRTMPAGGVSLNLDEDAPEGNYDEEDDEEVDEDEEVDANLIQMFAQAAAAQGISLDWIIEQVRAEQYADTSQPVEYPFDSLPTNTADLAEFILSDKCQRILILAGAGMSVSSGIPDFRSAGTGLYSTLDASSLTCSPAQQDEIRSDPSFALDQLLFLENPLPLLETKRDFILGTYEQRWKATLAHRFVELLHMKTGKLVRLYTQNIDGLEDQCVNLPEEKVIPVHGTMDRAECARCKTRMNFADFCHLVRNQIKDITGRDATAPLVSTAISCNTCGYSAVKPAIVLFRSSMPQAFFENVGPDVRNVDLLIVIGTSLKVAPANSLVLRVPRSALRVLVNREIVGEHLGMDFDTHHQRFHNDDNNAGTGGGQGGGRDFFAGGDCDDVLLELMEHLGWLPDLESLLADGQLPESSANLLHERITNRSSRRTDHDNGSGPGSGATAISVSPAAVSSPNLNATQQSLGNVHLTDEG